MKKTIIAILVLLSAMGASAQSLLWDSAEPVKTVTVGARLLELRFHGRERKRLL